MKIKTILLIILLGSCYNNCKTQFQAKDCEKQNSPNILLACNDSQPNLDFCLLAYSTYYRCKQDNSEKLYNNLKIN